MPTSPEYADYILGQISGAGEITHRKMFGGVGIYLDGVFCAIIGSSNRFYLRVGPNNEAAYISEGMSKFPGGKGKGMPYYEVPVHVVEDEMLLSTWAQGARDAAMQAKRK